MTLPYLHRPHDSGLIQWARGGVGLKPSAAPRPEILSCNKYNTPLLQEPHDTPLFALSS